MRILKASSVRLVKSALFIGLFASLTGFTTVTTNDPAQAQIVTSDVRQYSDKWNYGCAHEGELAARFAAEQDMRTTGPWMYDHHPDTGWPPDMGYWLGYRIDQSF